MTFDDGTTMVIPCPRCSRLVRYWVEIDGSDVEVVNGVPTAVVYLKPNFEFHRCPAPSDHPEPSLVAA